MKPIEAIQGTWTITDEVLSCVLSGYDRSYALGGSEDDEDLTIEAAVKLNAGSRVSILAFFTYADDWTESFVECVLDVAYNVLKIDLVNGGSRVTVAHRAFTLALGTEYALKVHATKETDGTGTVVFSVNGVNQLTIEDLGALFTSGLYGLAADGSQPTDSATFTAVRKYSMAGRYATIESVKDILLLYEQSDHDKYNEEIAETLKEADALIDSKVTVSELTGSSSLQLITSASANYAAWLMRKRRDPPGAEAFKAEAESFLEKLTESVAETGVGFAVGEAE